MQMWACQVDTSDTVSCYASPGASELLGPSLSCRRSCRTAELSNWGHKARQMAQEVMFAPLLLILFHLWPLAACHLCDAWLQALFFLLKKSGKKTWIIYVSWRFYCWLFTNKSYVFSLLMFFYFLHLMFFAYNLTNACIIHIILHCSVIWIKKKTKIYQYSQSLTFCIWF